MELSVQNIEVSIGAKHIVRGVSLRASEKQLVGIIGPNPPC